MKAAVYEQFQQTLSLQNLADPTPTPDGAVIKVGATGICRSDWHGWMGHDPDIRLPHVPGHEFAGVVAAVGSKVKKWRVGDRVTVPFVCACGVCPQCESGNQQVCDFQFQPGFTHPGSFAEFVAVGRADLNLVGLPETIDFVTAASLGCRFATSFRAVVDQGRVSGGEWVAVHGCGGVGLAAIMIASSLGANVVAVDISPQKLEFARSVGAAFTVNGAGEALTDVPGAIREISGGGVHLSIEALGSPITLFNSVACLRKRGRHVQVGLLLAEDKNCAVPMDRVIAQELELLGSHGMSAYRYPAMLSMITSGKLSPQKLIGRRVSLAEGAVELTEMNSFKGTGITVIDRFNL